MDQRTICPKTTRTGHLITATCKGCASECVVKFKTPGTPDEKGQKIEGACWVDGQMNKIFIVSSCKKIKVEVL
jgi:hypothetical protein